MKYKNYFKEIYSDLEENFNKLLSLNQEEKILKMIMNKLNELYDLYNKKKSILVSIEKVNKKNINAPNEFAIENNLDIKNNNSESFLNLKNELDEVNKNIEDYKIVISHYYEKLDKILKTKQILLIKNKQINKTLNSLVEDNLNINK